MFYRLIKSDWAIRYLQKDKPNPKFKKDIQGPKTIEGCLSAEEVKQLNELGYNAYWFPNHPASNVYENSNVKHLGGKHIEVFEYVFVDMDLKDGVYKSVEEFIELLAQFPVKPTITVKSGHGVHAYWRIENLSREAYVLTQFALLRHFKTDESVWTVLQLMRVPGSLNTKEMDNYRRADVEESVSSGAAYQLNQFPAEIFNISEDDKRKAQNHINKLEGRAEVLLGHEVDMDEIPEAFVKLIANDQGLYDLFHDPIAAYGDRSGADMKLANILFQKKFPKKEALQVIANTQKALDKGAYRAQYAQDTIDKAYVERTKNKFMTVGQMLRTGHKTVERVPVHGPDVFDCLVHKWSKKQVLGLVAGSGVGKTAVTLFIIKCMIENNPDNDDVFVFISLEMPAAEIVERWVQLVGSDSPLADRLYVIDTEDDETGDQRTIGLQEVYEYCIDIKTATGKEIGVVAMDHIGIISKHIDTTKDYTFGIESEQMAGWGQIKTMSMANLATQLKTLAKMLNTFVIPLTQTTKSKGLGYTPLGKDAAFGISQYENIVDYMITLWQPLMLVQDQVQERFLAWQYAKIRHQHKDDIIKPNSYKLLVYDMASGALLPPDEDQYKTFAETLPLAQARAKEKENKVETNYTRSLSIESLNEISQKLQLVAHNTNNVE